MKKNGIHLFPTVAVALLAVVIFMVFVSCDKAVKTVPEEEAPVTVKTEPVISKTLRAYIKTNGTIEVKNSIKVYPNMTGKIADTRIDLGSVVHKDQILIFVNPSVPGEKYALSPVIAPISGSVLSVPLLDGTKVTPDTPVVTIGDITNLQIRSYIPERYIALLKPGLAAVVKLEGYPDSIFNATVQKVSPVVDEISRTTEIILGFPVRDSRITAGMFAKIKLFTIDYPDSLVVPEESIIKRDGRTFVYMAAAGNTVVERMIKTGATVDSLVQVTDGLRKGERIVTDGVQLLQNGSRIHELSITKGEVK